MARPEKVADVKDRTNRIGEIDVAQFKTKGALMRGYGQFLAALEASGGHIEELPYGSSIVKLTIDKGPAALRDQLKIEQDEWDRNRVDYDKLTVDRYVAKSWRYATINRWASEEGLPELQCPTDAEYAAHEAAKALTEETAP